MTIRRKCLSTVFVSLCLVANGALGADAESIVSDMAEKVAGAEQFSFSIRMNYDAVQESGEKIEFSESRKVVIKRPNHLRIDVRQSDGDIGGLVYDGKVLTLFNDTENVYSQNNQAGDIDAALRYAVGTLGARVPLARMLVSNFPEELEKITTNVAYVEKNTLDSTPSHRLSGRTNKLDYQFWIGEDGLPTRLVVTYRREPGEPQFRAELSDWDLKPDVPDSKFVFSPPDGAEKIPTIVRARKSDAASAQAGGA